MALCDVRIVNYRAFEDTGRIRVPTMLALVGQNDAGKSALLHALDYFFDSRRKALPLTDVHLMELGREVRIELGFDPELLPSSDLVIDAKNPVDPRSENLLDADGLLRLQFRMKGGSKGAMEIFIHDIDDPELFGLALNAKEKDLLELLAIRGLSAVPSGKETNAEKREALRAQALTKGTGYRDDWVPLGDREKALMDLLPRFRFFTDEARYGMAETPVQSAFKDVVDGVMSSNPLAEQVEASANSTLQDEFDKVFGFLSRLTSQIQGIQAVADVDWKKAISGINVTWLDSFGADVPYAMRGAGIRRLFMVAYFQYQAVEGLHDPSGPKYIFAIEEPEVHLHPGAQRELMEALDELSELGHTVIFTTHSPVFASLVAGDALALVRRTAAAAEMTQHPALDLVQVAKELGVEAPDRLIGKNYVILVEGMSDVAFLEEALKCLHADGKTKLDPEKVFFIPCGGGGTLRFVASTEAMNRHANLQWAVIADSDRALAGGPLADGKLEAMQSTPPKSCSCFHILQRSGLENYYDPAAVQATTGMRVDIPEYGPPTYSDTGKLVPGKRLKTPDVARDICAAMGSTGLLQCSMTSETPYAADSEWVGIFEDIRVCFGI